MATLLNYTAVNTTAGIFADNAEKQRAATLAYSTLTNPAGEEDLYNIIFAGLTAQESQLQLRSNTLGINPVFTKMSTLNTVGDDIKINITGDQADETAAALRVLMRTSPTAKRLLSIVAEEAENAGAVFTLKTSDTLASAGTVVSGLYRSNDPHSIYINSSNRKNVLDIMMTIVHESGHALGPTLMDHGADHDLISKAVAAELAANSGITGGEKEIVTFNGKAVGANEVVAPAASTFLPAGAVTPTPVTPTPVTPTPVTPTPVTPTPANGMLNFTPIGGVKQANVTTGLGTNMTNYMTGMQQLTANNVAIASTGMNTALSMNTMNYPMPAMDTAWFNSFMSQIGGMGTNTMGGMGTTGTMNMQMPNLSTIPSPSIYNMESIFDTSKMLNMSMFSIPMSRAAPETDFPNFTIGNMYPEITSVFANEDEIDGGHGHIH